MRNLEDLMPNLEMGKSEVRGSLEQSRLLAWMTGYMMVQLTEIG